MAAYEAPVSRLLELGYPKLEDWDDWHRAGAHPRKRKAEKRKEKRKR